jgi:aryl-alcohol dehydrogenase-like predicted oxidoreductase
MRYKLLGPSGLRVSELCLGTMSFGEAWGFGADEKEAHRILSAFADAGGNFIDTANAYHEGQSEEIVGSFLGPGRDRFVVATKYTLAMGSGDPDAPGTPARTCEPRSKPACGACAPTTWTCCGCMPGTTPPRSRRSCAA